MAVVIDREKCDACWTCVDSCSTEALINEDGSLHVLEDTCIDCGACIPECPNEALSDGA